jgi:phosphatidylglycerol:prolipoprotein diacylglycerol transferase
MEWGLLGFKLYGLLLGLGIVLAGGLSLYQAKRWEISEAEVWSAAVWVLSGGILGARLYHVLDWWQYYSARPVEVLALWKGGMGIYGAIIGGLIGLGLYCWKNKKKFLIWADLVSLGLPLGQAIGRWGNYFNQELYGRPTGLPWGIYIKPENRLLSVMRFERFQPLFLYESLWSLLVFYLLMRLAKKKPKPGKLFFSYLGLYGWGRFWLEFLRLESWQIGGVNVAQAISLLLVGLSLVWWLRNKISLDRV